MSEVRRINRLPAEVEGEVDSIVRQVNEQIQVLTKEINGEINRGWSGKIVIVPEATTTITVVGGKITKVEQS